MFVVVSVSKQLRTHPSPPLTPKQSTDYKFHWFVVVWCYRYFKLLFYPFWGLVMCNNVFERKLKFLCSNQKCLIGILIFFSVLCRDQCRRLRVFWSLIKFYVMSRLPDLFTARLTPTTEILWKGMGTSFRWDWVAASLFFILRYLWLILSTSSRGLINAIYLAFGE